LEEVFALLGGLQLDSAYVLGMLARAAFEKGDNEQAVQWFERCRARDPNRAVGMECKCIHEVFLNGIFYYVVGEFCIFGWISWKECYSDRSDKD
jgi:hypothetical protein